MTPYKTVIEVDLEKVLKMHKGNDVALHKSIDHLLAAVKEEILEAIKKHRVLVFNGLAQ